MDPKPNDRVMVRYEHYIGHPAVERPATVVEVMPEHLVLSVQTGDPEQPVKVLHLAEAPSATESGWYWA